MEDQLTAGDVVALIVGIVAAVIAIVSVAIAIRANGIAKDANLEARQANEEAAKANRIAEEALEVQKTALPPAWSGMIQVSRSKVAFENQSGRNIVVTRVDAVPGGTRQMVQYTTEPPTRVEYGDTYEVMVIRAMGGSPEALKLHWHFEDETETQIAERRL